MLNFYDLHEKHGRPKQFTTLVDLADALAKAGIGKEVIQQYNSTGTQTTTILKAGKKRKTEDGILVAPVTRCEVLTRYMVTDDSGRVLPVDALAYALASLEPDEPTLDGAEPIYNRIDVAPRSLRHARAVADRAEKSNVTDAAGAAAANHIFRKEAPVLIKSPRTQNNWKAKKQLRQWKGAPQNRAMAPLSRCDEFQQHVKRQKREKEMNVPAWDVRMNKTIGAGGMLQ